LLSGLRYRPFMSVRSMSSLRDLPALASLRLAVSAAGCDGAEQIGNGDQGSGGGDRCVALETWRSSS
jgi:hypothetical protein